MVASTALRWVRVVICFPCLVLTQLAARRRSGAGNGWHFAAALDALRA